MSLPSVVGQRYKILEQIGEGGLGVVYRAEDTASGNICALKVMPRSGGRGNLRAEFLSMVHLRHENVVQVLDYGLTDKGDDYFTMELVEGGNIREASPKPNDPTFYPLVGGLFRALAFLHARGIVHADIKPSNVLIDDAALTAAPERAAKLVDFGLASHSTDPDSAQARGTFPYAAPEVYAGRLDARSDLYALGIIMFELVAGQSPFPGDNVVRVIREQQRGPAPDPRKLATGVPDGLAELIAALTDPEPAARVQTADEALARINKIAGTKFEVSEVEHPPIDLTGALLGRDRDLDDFTRLWDAAGDGRGGVLLVTGEEGIGKTRFLGELKLRTQLDGGRFYVARAQTQSSRPYPVFTQILRSVLADARQVAPSDEQRRRLAPLLGSPDQKEDVRDAESIDANSPLSLAESLVQVLVEATRSAPITIAIDDLLAAQQGEIDLFTYVARAAHSAGLVLIGTTSGDTTEVVRQLADVEQCAHIDLPPLSSSLVRTLLDTILGSELAAQLTQPLHRACAGNPAFLERSLQDLVDRKVLGRKRGHWHLLEPNPTIGLPKSASAVAQARVRTLSKETRELLVAASVLGEHFTLAGLAAITNFEPSEVTTMLSEAISARLLHGNSDDDRLSFVHRDIHDTIYKEASGTAALHAAAIEFLLQRAKGTSPEPAPGELARHYFALGQTDKAVALAMRAASQLIAVFDYHGAGRWLKRAAPMVEGKPLERLVRERLGDVHGAIANHTLACEHYERALQAIARGRKGDLPSSTASMTIRRKLAMLLRGRGHSEQAIDHLMTALGDARSSRLNDQEAACQLALAECYMYQGNYAASTEHASAGLLIAKACRQPDLCARLCKTLAHIAIYKGDTKTALEHVHDADQYRDSLTELARADLLYTTGRARLHAGEHDKACDVIERAIKTYQKMGLVTVEAKAHNNLGAAEYFLGDWDGALASWERCLQLCERMGNTVDLVSALNNLGSLRRDRGDFTEALATFDRGHAIAERIGRRATQWMILANRAEVQVRQGNLDSAKGDYARCLEYFSSADSRENVIETKRRLAELYLASGKYEEAIHRGIDTAREAQQADLKREEAILHRVVAKCLRMQGDTDSADWFLQQAGEIFATLGDTYENAKVDLELADLLAHRNKLGEATKLIEQCCATFAKLGARWDLAKARTRKGELSGSSSSPSGELSSQGIEALLDIARASGRMELEKLLDVVLEKILELCNFDRGFILLLDDMGRPTERMRRTRGSNTQEFGHLESEFSGSIVRRVAHTGKAIAVTDVADDEALKNQKSVVALGLRSVMCAPMQRQGRVTGIVYIDSQKLAETDSKENLVLLEAMAAQAAIAIENARLASEEQRKGELMAVLAHEIRNPLAGILGYSELQPDEKEAFSDEAVNLLQRIHSDGERLRRLVDNVLELARVEAGKVDWSMRPTNIQELLGDVKAAYDALAEKREVTLSVQVNDTVALALANPDRLFQVLTNLLGNALKFTPNGGTITLIAQTEVLDITAQDLTNADTDLLSWLPLEARSGGEREFVRVDVVDTGPGIAPEQQARLFEKFAQGQSKRSGGVGLGLFISREIISRHGGTIWVESELGSGTSFCFRIPAVP